MKSIWWSIWILGAFLVFATVDLRPDPPAVKPRIAQGKLPRACNSPSTTSDASAPVCEPIDFPKPVPDSVTSEHPRASDSLVLAGQVTDPSPPETRSVPPPSLQS